MATHGSHFPIKSDPEIGYELPLRVLVWDAGGQTRVGYRRPIEVVQNYAVTDQTELLDRMNRLLTDLVAESATAA